MKAFPVGLMQLYPDMVFDKPRTTWNQDPRVDCDQRIQPPGFRAVCLVSRLATPIHPLIRHVGQGAPGFPSFSHNQPPGTECDQTGPGDKRRSHIHREPSEGRQK